MRSARRKFRDALGRVEIPVPFSLEAFCESVAAQRRKPIILRAAPCRAECSLSAWVAAKDADYIYYPATVCRTQRNRVVLRLVCHILLGHRGRPAASLAPMITPAVTPRLAALLLDDPGKQPADAAYADQEEEAAEAMASMILDYANRGAPPGPAQARERAGSADESCTAQSLIHRPRPGRHLAADSDVDS